MYKNERYHEIVGERGLLKVISDVHSTNKGTLDRSFDDQLRDIEALTYALDNWVAPIEDNSLSRFDTILKKLVIVAISDHNMSKV